MSKKFTHEEYVEMVKSNTPHIKVVGRYSKMRDQIELYCPVHDYTYSISAAAALKTKHGCKYCSIDYVADCRRRTHEQFIEELKGVLNPNTIVLGEYKTCKDKIKCQCKDCGHIWYPVADSLLQGYGCKKCAMKYVQNLRIKSHEQFMQEFRERNPNYKTIDIITEYIKDDEPVKCHCNVCDHEWEVKAHNLIHANGGGTGCPICNTSKGERRVMNYLEDNNIRFEWQKTYDDLFGIGGGLLSYDFYLNDYNLLIEYQGEFHDGSAAYQTDEEFEYQKEHDRRKSEYAKSHNIELFEIWYQNFDNIEQILSEKLNIK